MLCIIKDEAMPMDIPSNYLLPKFKAVPKQKQKPQDVFTFGTRSLEKKFRECIKEHIHENPESIVPAQSDR
jgi:hypothetical protein